MASIHKQQNCKYWIAAFYRPNGKRTMRSTRETNKAQARTIADEYERPYREKMQERQIRRVMQDAVKDVTGSSTRQSNVREYFDSFLRRKQSTVAESSINAYRGNTKTFIQHLGEKADCDLCEITRDDVESFRDSEAARVKPKTANNALKFVQMVFNAARADGYLVDSPAEFVKPVSLKQRGARQAETRRPFTSTEIKAVLDQCNDEWRSLVTFALYTGQRLGDIACMTWENVDIATGEIRLTTRKTGRFQNIPICKPLMKHIMTLQSSDDPREPVHPDAYSIVETEGRTSTLSRQFADILMLAGLREKKQHRKKADSDSSRQEANGLSFHSLRHTATTLLKAAGVSDVVAREIIGHDSEAVSRVYTHIDSDMLKKAVANMKDILK